MPRIAVLASILCIVTDPVNLEVRPALASWVQDSSGDIDQVIRSLADPSKETRKKAVAALMGFGKRALPALKNALDADDPWVREGAMRVIAEFDRPELERMRDATNRKKVLASVHRHDDSQKAFERTFPHAVDGGRFRVVALSYKEGLILESTLYAEVNVQFEFDVTSVTDRNGMPLAIERCGRCSPGRVYVRHGGPVSSRIAGIRRWYSHYDVEFIAPENGDQKRIGDFIITVKWPHLEITSPRRYGEAVLRRICNDFEYGNIDPEKISRSSRNAGVGERPGATLHRDSWCTCKEGPKAVERSAIKEQSVWKVESRSIPPGTLDSVESITLTFLKPMEEPFEFDVPMITPTGSWDKPTK